MTYSPELIRALARRHGLDGQPTLLPNGGMVNEAWRIGEGHVLRIVRVKGCDEEAARESAVVPLVVEAGVKAPRLVGGDVAGEPRPYTIYEHAEGTLLGYLDRDPSEFEPAYFEIGREIAAIGRIPVTPRLAAVLRRFKRSDPRDSLQRAEAKGLLDRNEVVEIGAWIGELEPRLGRCRRRALVHQDIHPWNVFVDPDTRALTAIIDWGDTALGDPAAEFASMPLVAVGPMLDGYREAGGYTDPGFLPRILWYGLALALWEMRELDPREYKTTWWRLGPRGWPGMKETLERLFDLGPAP